MALVREAPARIRRLSDNSTGFSYRLIVRLCSISVDLDEIACYSAIHGLQLGADCHAVYDHGLQRIRDFAAGFELPVTLFVVARDLARQHNRNALRLALSEGHEIGNHSRDHLYDLARRDRAELTRQVLAANEDVAALIGVRPRGFRAPGYTVSDTLMSVLQAAEFSYDSSVFPCPAYYVTKAAVLLGMKVLGRASDSILDTPRVLCAPTTPYRTGAPYWRRGSGMLELPIQVASALRLPFIGTTLTMLGPNGARRLTRSLLGIPFVNLELHAIDFLAPSEVPPALLALQPDLRLPLARKMSALSAVVECLRSHGYAFARMDEAARSPALTCA